MFKKTPAPDAGYQFHRWQGPIPPLSKAEIRLTELRRMHGNGAGTRIFRKQLWRGEVRL